MKTIKKIKNDLVQRLKSASPQKIILFGSLAQDNFQKNSDIDLLVVTDSDKYPKNYKDKMDIYLEVAKKIDDYQKKYPIDLVVHTKPMFKKFIELNSQFAKEITEKGQILYEKDKSGMA